MLSCAQEQQNCLHAVKPFEVHGKKLSTVDQHAQESASSSTHSSSDLTASHLQASARPCPRPKLPKLRHSSSNIRSKRGHHESHPRHTPLVPRARSQGEALLSHFRRLKHALLLGHNLELYCQAKANKVIQAHKLGFFGHFKHHKKPKCVFSSDIEADVDNAASSMSLCALRSGVLSTLLTLYDYPCTPSAPSSSKLPTPSRPSFNDSSKPSFANDYSRFSFDTLSCTFTSPSVGSLTSTAVGAPSTSRNCTFNFILPSALGDSRPTQSHSTAGIFGPLIASTGNIADAAAPR
ncbi:hypothetical protein EW146_g9820 [Bondarzewia mesenterica]|uniref:Uncharacterized protein n=1 Tax=Bondarzewia mesenterica TaxID=1095465 RepID=A0A4S4L7W5_9AGAM|nr:hypothetical protein EW146_g9820 [Bondarzewia mesenterica]